jgi:hypothetical protein
MAINDPNTGETATATPQRTKSAARKRAGKRISARARRTASLNKPSQTRSPSRDYGRAATGLARRGKRLVDDAYGWVGDARHAVPRLTKGMHLPSPRALESFAEANPVLLGAVGLGIGVVIGALLPRDAMHGGMRGFGLAGSSEPVRKTRSRKASARK